MRIVHLIARRNLLSALLGMIGLFKTKRLRSEFVFDSIIKESLETIADLMKKYIKSLSALPDEALKALLSRRDVVGFIARKGENSKEVGFIFGTLFPVPTIAFLATLDPESARKGLGEMLIDEFAKEVKRRQPKTKHITVALPSKMTDGVALYSSKGFVIQGFVKGTLKATDMVHMRKSLRKRKGLFLRP